MNQPFICSVKETHTKYCRDWKYIVYVLFEDPVGFKHWIPTWNNTMLCLVSLIRPRSSIGLSWKIKNLIWNYIILTNTNEITLSWQIHMKLHFPNKYILTNTFETTLSWQIFKKLHDFDKCKWNHMILTNAYETTLSWLTYGSVSAGRGKCLFNVLFFLKVKPPCDQTW